MLNNTLAVLHSAAITSSCDPQVWRFSTAFSPVLSWRFADLPSMSHHLAKCHFNVVEQQTEPVPLPAMSNAQDGQALRRALRHINT